MEHDEWTAVRDAAKKFAGSVVLYEHNDQMFLVTWSFELWWWDPIDGCFMPTEKVTY